MDKDEIIKDLTDKITLEEYAQGQWLVERELCEQYGVSRTPIREALSLLSTTGLVEQLPGKGYRVRELKLEDLIEIFNAREAVETMNARLACQMADDKLLSDLALIKKALLEGSSEKDVLALMDHGRSFHDMLAHQTRNSILNEFYFKLRNLVFLTRIITRQIPDLEENSRIYHAKIIDAIERRDPDESEAMMREHLRLTCRFTIDGYINVRTGYTKTTAAPSKSR